jgi:DNA-binding NarL/FixJ family response regulator
MDIRVPRLDGIAATRAITADEDLTEVRVLILTTFEQDEHVFTALRAGANGFLGKSVAPDALLEAIRTVMRGDARRSARRCAALPGGDQDADRPCAPGHRAGLLRGRFTSASCDADRARAGIGGLRRTR